MVKEMEGESTKLRAAKQELENVLASGGSLTDATAALDRANESYKQASLPIKKHTQLPKAKAKAKAAA